MQITCPAANGLRIMRVEPANGKAEISLLRAICIGIEVGRKMETKKEVSNGRK